MLYSVAYAYETDYNVDISSYDAFRRDTNGKAYDLDGSWGAQCWDGVQLLYTRIGMHLYTRMGNENPGYAKYCWLNENARAANTGDKFIQITDKTQIKRGDILVFDQFSEQYNTGHIAFADEDWDDSGYIHVFGQNQKPITDYGSAFEGTTYYTTSKILGAFRYKGWNEEVHGTPMSVGYDRVLPDGDYLIAAAGTSDKTSYFYLDIEGTAVPAAKETNVSLCGPLAGDPPSYEIWTVTYDESSKFYTIQQYGTNMCLDVYGADTKQGQNVQVYSNNGGPAQQWAISRNGSNGFRLQARCSGMSLDISGGGVNTNGTNVQQWGGNDSAAQSWLFIPYKPAQPIEEGRYVLLYTENPSHELDVSGDSGDVSNNTQVQIWNDDALSQFNSFDFIKLSNGYYKVRHAASGKCLDVTGGSTNYKAKAAVYDDNGSIAQQWAVVPNGAGYSLISRCNGYALDLPDGTLSDGTAIEVYPRLGNNNQRWSFVQAEKSIWYYAADAESGVPATQTKYYKTPLTISEQVPVQTGYTFQYWEDLSSLNVNMEAPRYYPGDTYTEDHPMTLYAVWEANEYTITYNANGGAGAPEAVTVEGGESNGVDLVVG